MSVDITREPYRESGNVVRDSSTETRPVIWLYYKKMGFQALFKFVKCWLLINWNHFKYSSNTLYTGAVVSWKSTNPSVQQVQYADAARWWMRPPHQAANACRRRTIFLLCNEHHRSWQLLCWCVRWGRRAHWQYIVHLQGSYGQDQLSNTVNITQCDLRC